MLLKIRSINELLRFSGTDIWVENKKKSIVLENIYRERILHGGAKLRILFSSGKTISYYYHIERAQRVGKMILLTRCDRS